MRNKNGTFVKGRQSENHAPCGTVRIRTQWKRGKKQRAFVKVAEPNVWKLRAVVVWESINGPVPNGFGVHHVDGNTLNDTPTNLNLVSKSEHLAIHRKEFQDRAIAGSCDCSWRCRSASSAAVMLPTCCRIHRRIRHDVSCDPAASSSSSSCSSSMSRQMCPVASFSGCADS